MAVPGEVVEVDVIEPSPGDIVVRLTLGTGAVLDVPLRDTYDPPPPSVDAVDAYEFLLMQNTPPLELQRALDAFDPEWEEKVEARKRDNDRRSGSA